MSISGTVARDIEKKGLPNLDDLPLEFLRTVDAPNRNISIWAGLNPFTAAATKEELRQGEKQHQTARPPRASSIDVGTPDTIASPGPPPAKPVPNSPI